MISPLTLVAMGPPSEREYTRLTTYDMVPIPPDRCITNADRWPDLQRISPGTYARPRDAL